MTDDVRWPDVARRIVVEGKSAIRDYWEPIVWMLNAI
jgi:hypothetical protein